MTDLSQEFEKKLNVCSDEIPKPVRIRIRNKRVVQNCDVYVGRPCSMGGWSKVEQVKKGNSRWCNPFKVRQKRYSHLGGDGEKLQAILEDYENHIREKIQDNPNLLEELRDFRGKTLGCFCIDQGTPDDPKCHATIIAKLFIELIQTET